MQVTGKLCSTGEAITLTLANGKIAGWTSGELRDPQLTDGEILGGPDVYLSAGFLDLQLNGYGGHDFNFHPWANPSEISHELAPLFEKIARSGTALFCPTITTGSREAMTMALRHLSHELDRDRRMANAVPGIHVEGPYLSQEDGPRGAHALEQIRDPDWDEFQEFQEAADGRIRLFTLAPERPGALRFIERLVETGVTVALGHTAATAETIRVAVHAGATLSTHLGNGAHARIQRHPNYIWEQLACDELYASVILDGHHLPASVARVFGRTKGPEKLTLVSDAVALGGLPPGIYGDGRCELLPSGKIVLAGTPYLAGAGHLLDTGVANALRFTDLTLAQATKCVSAIPARILGLESRKGHLRTGYDADLTLFRVQESGTLEIVATICAGEVVYLA